MTDCKHEKLIPEGANENYNLMNWYDDGKESDLKVNMCKKCHLLYWENKI